MGFKSREPEMKRLTAAATVLTLIAGGAAAGSSGVTVDGAWARSTGGQMRPGAAYMEISNQGSEPATLVGIESAVASRIEIHRSTTDDSGVTRMEPVGKLIIPPGGSIALAPRGMHVMLMGLGAPLDEGDDIDLTLLFGDGHTLELSVPVESPGASGPSD